MILSLFAKVAARLIDSTISFTLGHHGPGHPRNLVSKRDGGDLDRAPHQQCREPGPMSGAVDVGIADDSKCSGHEQAAQIAVTLFTDAAEPLLAPNLSAV
jgi:hypothetical protein